MLKPKKDRLFKEGYNATEIIPFHKAFVFQVDKGVRRSFGNQKLNLKAESGKCDVCAAPCSSCLHVKRDPMEKADEISYKRYGEKILANSVNAVRTDVKNRTCEPRKFESVSSKYNTFSENAESKVHMKTSHTKKFDDDGPSMLSGSANQNTVPFTSSDRLLTQGCEKDVQLQIASVSVDLKSELSSHHLGLIENCSSELPGRSGDNLGCDVEKSSHGSDEYENSKFSLGNQKEIVIQNQKKDVGANNNGGNFPEEPSKPPEHGIEDVVSTLNVKEMSADDSDESEAVEHDVKVCDICGDAGREDLLAICCRCIDGAEHTYCMKQMIDEVPEGDWLCEECKLDEENKNTKRQRYGTEVGAEKAQSSGSAVEEPRTSKDYSVVKVSSKRRAEELESSSAFKKRALEVSDSSTKDVDRGKVKIGHQFSSDSLFGSVSSEAARSPATRPRLQSLRGALMKSNSFSFPTQRSKTKLVDDIVLQRQKSTKERTSHDTIVAKEMGKSMSFRSTNLRRFGAGGSKVKMLSPTSSHVQDLKSLKAKKERIFERNNSVKSASASSLSTSISTALTPKVDKLLVSHGETTSVSSACNSEAKPLKSDSKMIAGLKSTSCSANIGAEAPVSLGPVNKQLTSSLHGVGSASSSGIISSTEQKSAASKDDNSSKLMTSKDSTNLADGIKETTTNSHLGSGLGSSSVSSQNHKHTGYVHTADRPVSAGPNASVMRSSKEVKNRDNKLKDAIEAALLKKPGIYRKNRVADQPDEPSVLSMNNDTAFVDRTPHSRNTGNLTSMEVLTDSQGHISGSSIADHFKQSNGKHSMTELATHDVAALSSPMKISAIPDYEYIWQGGFEISKSGKTAEFWDGLQAHMSSSASPKVFEAVNKLPDKILLNGVSRISAWPEQFENNGAKEDNIALYFFAKDVESYEKSYQLLLDDMIRGDLALIGSIGGVELLIFPSNQLPEKSHRWNMLFFLWGVFRGKKNNSLHQAPDFPEKSCIPQVASSISTEKNSLAEDTCSLGSIEKDTHVDSESKGNLKLQDSSQEKVIGSISSPVDSVKVVPTSSRETLPFKPVPDGNVSLLNKSDSQDVVKYSRNPKVEQGSSVTEVPSVELNHLQMEPRKRPFIDLSEDVGFNEKNQMNMWHDTKQKKDLYGGSGSVFNTGCALKDRQCEVEESGVGNSNGERHFFPVDPTHEVKDVRLASSFQERGRAPKFKLALDLNEDISSCLVGDIDNTTITKKEEEEEEEESSLSLSLSFSRTDKDEQDRGKGNRHSTPSMLLFRDTVDK